MEKIKALKECKSLWQDTKKQLHHGVMRLIVWTLIAGLAAQLLLEVIALSIDPLSMAYQALSFVISLVNMVFVNTIMFLFIKRVRNESFSVKDIMCSSKMILYHIVMGFILNILRTAFQEGCYLVAFFPLMFYILLYLILAFFMYWQAIIAFAIYDQDHKLSEYFAGGFRLLYTNKKTLLLLSIPYVIVCYLSQLVTTIIFLQVFDSTASFSSLIASFADAKNQVGLIAITYVIYYLLQALMQVGMLLMVANLYDRYHTLYLPDSGRKKE